MNKVEHEQNYYDERYFLWQSSIGEFGGWANLTKFVDYISDDDAVLDYGCGGGYLLKNICCRKKVGVDINTDALKMAWDNGIEAYTNVSDIPDESIDVIISNHALEHVKNPFLELTKLYKVLKTNGKIIFVIPCETIKTKFKKNDINNHLYSWGPLCFGNLFKKSGFSIIESKPYMHKWPPNYKRIARIGGRKIFDLFCKVYARIERSSFQVRLIAMKN